MVKPNQKGRQSIKAMYHTVGDLIDCWCLTPHSAIFQLYNGDDTVGTMPKSYKKLVERSTINTANT